MRVIKILLGAAVLFSGWIVAAGLLVILATLNLTSSIEMKLYPSSAEKHLYRAAFFGVSGKEVAALLNQYPLLVTATEEKSKLSYLHVAVQLNEKDLVVILLAAHADPNRQDGPERISPLDLAARFNKNADIAKILVHEGAQLNLRNAAGKVPLEVATEVNNTPLVNYFKNPLEETQEPPHKVYPDDVTVVNDMLRSLAY